MRLEQLVKFLLKSVDLDNNIVPKCISWFGSLCKRMSSLLENTYWSPLQLTLKWFKNKKKICKFYTCKIYKPIHTHTRARACACDGGGGRAILNQCSSGTDQGQSYVHRRNILSWHRMGEIGVGYLQKNTILTLMWHHASQVTSEQFIVTLLSGRLDRNKTTCCPLPTIPGTSTY